jgi:hypothetical protein
MKTIPLKNVSVRKTGMFNVALCFQDVTATVLNYYGLDFSFPLLKCLNLGYKRGRSGKIGESLSAGYNILDIYKEYGLTIKKERIEDIRKFAEYIRSEIDEGTPIITHFDAYYLKWDPVFRKIHNGHMVIVNGYDEEKDEVIVCDPHFNKTDERLSVTELERASRFYFKIVGFNAYKRKGYREEIAAHLSALKEGGYYRKLKAFCSDLADVFDPQTEFKDQNNAYFFNASPLYLTLVELIKARMLFLVFAEEAHKWAGVYADTLAAAKTAADTWILLYNVMIKNYHSRYKDGWRERLKGASDKVCLAENRLSAAFMADEGKSAGFSARVCESTQGLIFESVDIRRHFNNKGFATELNPSVKPDITGNGEYVYADENLAEYGVDFTGELDNVSCAGQEIELSGGFVCGVRFFILAEWGNFCGGFRFVDAAGNSLSAEIMFHDLQFKEKTAARVGSTYYARQIEDEKFRDDAYANAATVLFDKKIPLKKIVLPDCPNLHLLSLAVVTEAGV